MAGLGAFNWAQVGQPLLFTAHGNNDPIPCVFLGNTHGADESATRSWVLMHGLTLEEVNEQDVQRATGTAHPLLTALSAYTSLSGATAKWTLAGVSRMPNAEQKKHDAPKSGAPQLWKAALRGRRTTASKHTGINAGTASCAPLANVLFQLWLAKHGWEPGEAYRQPGKMLGLDAEGHDIRQQVVAHLGLTMSDVEAMVSSEAGADYQAVINCVKAGTQPAGSSTSIGKRAAPDAAAGPAGLQGPPSKKAHTVGSSPRLPCIFEHPSSSSTHSGSKQSAGCSESKLGPLKQPSFPQGSQQLAHSSRTSPTSRLQGSRLAGAKSSATVAAAAAAAATYHPRVSSVSRRSNHYVQQLQGHAAAHIAPRLSAVQQSSSSSSMPLGSSAGIAGDAGAAAAAWAAAGTASGVAAGRASRGSIATAETTTATRDINVCREFIKRTMQQGSTLPLRIYTGGSDSARVLNARVERLLGSGGQADVLEVSVEDSGASGAGSSSNSSSTDSGRQLYALKVFTFGATAKPGTTLQMDHLSAILQKQQQCRALGNAVQCTDDRLHAVDMDTEQQMQQTQADLLPGHAAHDSVQQQPSDGQHQCSTAADSGGGKSAVGAELPGQLSFAGIDGSTAKLPTFLEGAVYALGSCEMSRDHELINMLLARGDARTAHQAMIASGGEDEDSLLPAAKPESELCQSVLAVHGWGEFTLWFKELQVPVLLLELATTSLDKLLQAISATNRACLRGVRLLGLTRQETLYLTKPLVEALQSAHKANVMHRDIKPANVLLTGPPLTVWWDAQRRVAMRPDVKKYQAKLGDFGVARELEGGELASTVTGTPGTAMAPEVLCEHRRTPAAVQCMSGQAGAAGEALGGLDTDSGLQYDKSVDVYSLGTLWLDMRFGRAFAYLGPSTPIVEQRYTAAELDNPDCDYTARGFKYQGGALSALEKSFVQACIAKDPAQRWTAERLLGHPYLAQ